MLITPLVLCLLISGLASHGVQNSAHAVNAVTVPEPISLYKFDETTGATTIADSIRGAKGLGTLYNSPTFEPGKVGNSLCLNGSSQYATAPLVGNGLKEFTISAWAKLDQYSNWATIAKNWGDLSVGAFHLGLGDGADNNYWSNYIGKAPNTPEGVVSSSPTKATVGKWEYIVTTVSQSQNTAKLYINGTLISTDNSFSGPIANFETLMSFGAKLNNAQTAVAGVNPGWFDGCLDEIAFWDVALSEAQVDSIIDNGGAAPSPFTITYDANTGTGSVPAATTATAPQTVVGNTGSPALAKPGFIFDGWNTQVDGTGLPYNAGDALTSTTHLTLYAQWKAVAPTPDVTSNEESTLADTGDELDSFHIAGGAAVLSLCIGLTLMILRRKIAAM